MDINTLTPDQLMQLPPDSIRRAILACGMRINAIRFAISQNIELDRMLSETWRSIVQLRKILYARLEELRAQIPTPNASLSHAA